MLTGIVPLGDVPSNVLEFATRFAALSVSTDATRANHQASSHLLFRGT